MRWIYAPHQRRYLYWAMFLFGICFTNHQSLIVAAMGIVAAIAAADRKLGRATFLWIAAVYIGGVILKQQGVLFRDTNEMIFMIFNVVGLTSIALYVWFTINAEPTAEELIREILQLAGSVMLMVGLLGTKKFFIWPAIAALGGFSYFAWMTRKRGIEWFVGLIAGLLFAAGAAFYLYMPLAGMSTPPMQWGYPRTVEGFIHAFTRGQYEKTNPTPLFTADGMERYVGQLGMLFEGIVEEFNWVYMLVAIVPFMFFLRMQKRERAWVIGISAIYFCLGPLLLLLINPPPDRQARELIRVFFTASHVLLAMGIGYGLTMIAAEITTRYEQIRGYLLIGGIAAVDFALFSLMTNAHTLLADYGSLETAQYYGLAKLCAWLLAMIGALVIRQMGQKDPLITRGVPGLFILASFGVTVAAIMKEKFNFAGFGEMATAFSRVFQPDQYAVPVFAGLILVGMAVTFLVTVLLKRKLAPIGITLVLFAMMPIHTFMTHWSDNEQRGHLFGYWFGHDMFTPPFVGPDGKFGHHDSKTRAEMMKDPVKGKFVYPEMTRDAVLYGGTDPGRFCPTYMVFSESFVPPECKKDTNPDFDRRDVYVITQNALADGTYLNYIRSHYNRSAQSDPPFFQAFFDPNSILPDAYTTNTAGLLAYRFLDKPLIALGKRIEDRRRREGVYPPKEMYIATPDDSQRCFQEYLQDAQKRLEHDSKFPNEPRQIRPGEDVRIVENRVQVSGQIAVMAINGLITKVMFDKNPTNEFFVEESFPLDWMYPHLTPSGVIMKINREKQITLTDEVLQRDHEFWSQYSGRLIGNWINYDTTVKEIVDFVEKVYLRRDFKGFKGDRKFVRDDQAQKAFSKLRSSIGGVYAWRIGASCPPEFRPKTSEEYERIRKEADFTFRQAFAFCPYSPEAVFRYVQLLLQFNRVSDALLVAKTCLKLDPYNGQVIGLVQNLEEFESRSSSFTKLETEFRNNPTNFQNSLNLAQLYLQMGRPDSAVSVLDAIMSHPKVNGPAMLAVAEAFNSMQNFPKLEAAMEKLAVLMPESGEALYDLAALKATFGKNQEALTALQKLAGLKNRGELLVKAKTDARFAALQSLADFQKLFSGK
jgi:tetratricopeptide (TPR) repeat protein